MSSETTFGGLMEIIRTAEDSTSLSLPQFIKRCTINSRVFIESGLESEEALNNLLSVLMNLYTGFVMTAMHMNQHITATKKVRDLMSVVATESFAEKPIMLSDCLNQAVFGDARYVSPHAKNLLGSEVDNSLDVMENGSTSGGPSSIVNVTKDMASVPSGRILEIKFNNSNDKQPMVINMTLQLLPSFIPSEVVEQFVAINFTPSIKQRYLQASAGEISMIGDLLLGNDIRRRKFQALKKDKTGKLKEMQRAQDNALSDAWLKYAQVTPDRQNISNTILIFEKHTFDKACSNNGLKFKDFNSRQKFFNKTFSMIVCVVDVAYSRVEIYYHGLEAVSSYRFEQLAAASKKDGSDIMTTMQTLARGMAPKF